MSNLKNNANDLELDELIKRHYSSMLIVARQIVGNSIADEVVQEAWVSIQRALPKFEGRSSVKTWIMTITVNEAKTRLRKESRYISLDPDSEWESPLNKRFDRDGVWSPSINQWHDDNPESLLTNKEMSKCLDSKMGLMPDIQKTVFTLKDLEGFSFKEICNILEISASNARVLLHRARLNLFTTIDHFQETGEC
jgi:RNA polymerase sigma-70 factor (ECF subfamily)